MLHLPFYENGAKSLLYLCNSGEPVLNQLDPTLSNIGVSVDLLKMIFVSINKRFRRLCRLAARFRTR